MHASIVSDESHSAIRSLHPISLASGNPSLIAIASARLAEATCDIKEYLAATKLPWKSQIIAATTPALQSAWKEASALSLT
jgi:hypothetical protein